MQGRGGQVQGNGNGRGVQGRPDVKARERFGEERVADILREKKEEISALFANDPRPDAMYTRACALSIGAYRNIQETANESAARQNKSPQRIDEVSSVACCIMAMQRKLDPGTDLYLVPYGGKVTAILSPDGVIKLLFRTGMVRAVNARYVFRGSPNPGEYEEYFEYVLGSQTEVKHRKNNARPRAAKDGRGQVGENVPEWEALSHAYAIIDLKDGGQTVEVLDKGDIAYFRSLSPTGDSQFGGWAKFPAAFARKAALKQAAKFVPKDSEVSIILTSDDTEQGIAIPKEIWDAVGARMLGEMTGEVGPGTPTPAHGEQSPPETQHSKKPAPQPGDPQKIMMPGQGQQPTIWNAEDDALVKAEVYCRGMFEAGKWPPNYFEKNALQLATIRQEIRDRNALPDRANQPPLPLPPQAWFDGGLTQAPAPQELVYTGTNAGQTREPGED